ncbi:MAG: DNA mismatch repair endonuclease MutL [Halobacteriaceae archaeon]
MPEIRELDPQTVERIAAGEVVERPASVVKELVENSLDAGASRVDVTVEAGGSDLVRVRDDGHGMGESDVRAAVRKHTTSKIRDIDDLESGVATLGFRGEALHTVGAVSKTTITTRREADDAGTELRLEGGEVVAVTTAGCPVGTAVEVRDLFYNTPARREYLKTESTEFAHVNRVVTRYALANPGVAVSLTHGDREVFATPGRGNLREALLAVYGREVAESMVPVGAEGEGLDRVHGFVSDPETTRSTREYVSTFVNGRYVSDSLLREGVLAGYGNQLAADRYPFAVLFCELPGEDVDVNVHPRKMEVRFAAEEAVRADVEAAVREALLEAGLVRSSAPRGRSAPDDAEIAPGREGPSPGGDESETGGESGTEAATGARSADDGAGTSRPDPESTSEPRTEARAESSDGPATDRRDAGGAAGDPDPETGPATTGSTRNEGDGNGADEADGDPAGATRERGGEDASPAPDAGAGPDDGSSARSTRSEGRKFSGETHNATLPGTERPEPEFDALPAMRVLGQVHDTYVVAETDDGLVLVDQHAADERVNYERLARDLADGPDSQALVAPVELELTAGEAAVFGDALPDLRALGFEAALEGTTATVSAVPAVFASTLDPDLLRDVLAEFLSNAGEGAVESAADELLADMACYPAITGNTSLREGSVTALLEALDGCENPFACPHGRPVVIELSGDELADRFERDYPGHAVRRPED